MSGKTQSFVLVTIIVLCVPYQCDAAVNVQFTSREGYPCRDYKCTQYENGYYCHDGALRNIGYNPISFECCSPEPGLACTGERCSGPCSKGPNDAYYKCTVEQSNELVDCSPIYNYTVMKAVGGDTCRHMCSLIYDGKYYCYHTKGLFVNWDYCSPSPGFSVTGKRCTSSCIAGKCNTDSGREDCSEPISEDHSLQNFNKVCEKHSPLPGAARHGNELFKQDVSVEKIRAEEGEAKSRSVRELHWRFKEKHIKEYTPEQKNRALTEIQENASAWMIQNLNRDYRIEERRDFHTFLFLTRQEQNSMNLWSDAVRTDQGPVETPAEYETIVFKRLDNNPNSWIVYQPLARRRVFVQACYENFVINHFVTQRQSTQCSTFTPAFNQMNTQDKSAYCTIH